MMDLLQSFYVFAHMGAGLIPFSQYTFLFILSINPGIFRLFKQKHYALFAFGVAASVFQSRAILPVMLLIMLDLDYSHLDKKDKLAILAFFMLQVLILLTFGGWHQ